MPEELEARKAKLIEQSSPGLAQLYEEAVTEINQLEDPKTTLRTFMLAAYFKGYRDGVITAKLPSQEK